jgi:hypothetical protein
VSEDEWIREQARQHKEQNDVRRAASEKAQRRTTDRRTLIQTQLPGMWTLLSTELQRKIDIYNQLTDSKTLTLNASDTLIVVSGERHEKQVVVQLALEKNTGELVTKEHTRTRHGGKGEGSADLFLIVGDGTVLFASQTGGKLSPESAADHVLRRVLHGI